MWSTPSPCLIEILLHITAYQLGIIKFLRAALQAYPKPCGECESLNVPRFYLVVKSSGLTGEFLTGHLLCITARSLMMLMFFFVFFFLSSVQKKERERERARAARESLLIRRVEPVFHTSNNPKEGPFIMAPCEIYICLALITDLSGWRSSQFKDGLLYCRGAKCMGFWGVYFSLYFCQFVWPCCRIAAFPHGLHGYVRVYWLCVSSWEGKAERAVRWVTECHYKCWLKAAYEDL